MARGRDASDFYPDVVRNVITKSVELKKLVYSYVVAYADFNDKCREMSLMSIISFTRDLSDANQLVRGTALRVLASIRVREIVQIQLMSLKKCASDSSSYVKKTAAQSAGKVFQIDNEAKPEVVEVIERLLADKNTQVLSSAMSAFNSALSSAISALSSALSSALKVDSNLLISSIVAILLFIIIQSQVH
jgi:AP-3 complex subunit beta